MGDVTATAFLRRLATRMALNPRYREIAFFFLLFLIVITLSTILLGARRSRFLEILEAPFVGNLALAAWTAVALVDVSFVATWCKVEQRVAAAAFQPFLLAYQVPTPIRWGEGSIQGRLAFFLPTDSRTAEDAAVRSAHMLHNWTVMLGPLAVFAAFIAVLTSAPPGVLIVSGWGACIWAATLLRPRAA